MLYGCDKRHGGPWLLPLTAVTVSDLRAAQGAAHLHATEADTSQKARRLKGSSAASLHLPKGPREVGGGEGALESRT